MRRRFYLLLCIITTSEYFITYRHQATVLLIESRRLYRSLSTAEVLTGHWQINSLSLTDGLCMMHFDDCFIQGGHSSGKPGKVRELKSGKGKVRENRKNQGKVRENELLQLFSCRDYCSDSNW